MWLLGSSDCNWFVRVISSHITKPRFSTSFFTLSFKGCHQCSVQWQTLTSTNRVICFDDASSHWCGLIWLVGWSEISLICDLRGVLHSPTVPEKRRTNSGADEMDISDQCSGHHNRIQWRATKQKMTWNGGIGGEVDWSKQLERNLGIYTFGYLVVLNRPSQEPLSCWQDSNQEDASSWYW